MTQEIPERAAWLDHEVAFIGYPSIFEVDRLGLDVDDLILLENQVDLHLDRKAKAAIIVVKSIEPVEIDEENKQMSYIITDVKKYIQHWEVGGTHLKTAGTRLMLD